MTFRPSLQMYGRQFQSTLTLSRQREGVADLKYMSFQTLYSSLHSASTLMNKDSQYVGLRVG